MCDFVKETLEAWGLSEYIEKFEGEKIDKEVFLNMPEAMISELIPTVGKRYYFIKSRTSLLECNNNSEDSNSNLQNKNKVDTQESSDLISIVSSSSVKSCEDGKKLMRLLSQSFCGKKILSKERLTPSDRSKICHLIIDKLLCECQKIKSEEFVEWSAEVVSIFKYEKTSTYYVPSNSKVKRLATGKLWDKYNNLKKYLREQEKYKKLDENHIEKSDSECSENAILVLRTIQPDDTNLINIWKDTFKIRSGEISISKYYDEYPILKTSIGAILLQIDFELKTGVQAHIFPKKWSGIAPYILNFAVQKEFCPSLCDLQNDIQVETLSFLILPYLFKPSFVKTGGKLKWKPSKIEVSESFIYRIPTTAELEPRLQKRQEKLLGFGLTVQPMVVAVGPIVNLTDFYVFVNDIKYVSTSLMSAIDLCFNAFFALDAKYPADSEMVWYFLQCHVYGITNKEYARNYISVDTVWHDIDELMSTSFK
ncbi:uncharacterized protein [Prorops nasuta]|uniref:uncharacterized protein n=1 Tax=Prorops nasuta TaxID=863751 RepID=UPI0034CE1B45